MNGSIAAFFGLMGFLIPLLVTNVLSRENDDKSPKIIEGSLKGKAIAILCITGAFCCLIMVLQGFHLWRSWEIPQIDSSKAATISTKARGRGGFILLIIRFFPQFLVFGYSLWGWQLKPYFPKAIKLWG